MRVGQSPTGMHLIAGLLHQGFAVGSIDLDAGQATLTRYGENRHRTNTETYLDFPMSYHRRLPPNNLDGAMAAAAGDKFSLDACAAAFAGSNGVIVIDTPGSDIAISHHAHSLADTLVTPLNYSYINLDLLAVIDPDSYRVIQPSRYAKMVWEQKKVCAMSGGCAIDWVVMRKRIGSLALHYKAVMESSLSELAGRIGFRLALSFTGRAIFRELFLQGLTLLGLHTPGVTQRLNSSHIAARQEVRQLLIAIALPNTPGTAQNGAGYGNQRWPDPI